MNIARLVVLGVAVVTAAVSAFLVRNMITQEGPAEAAQQPTIQATRVLVAGRDLALGETVQSGDLVWQVWPEEGLSLSYINEKAQPNARSDWAGAFVRVPFVAGEPVSQSKLVTSKNQGVMSAILEPGMRAVGIEISAESGAGGFILPNDRVDVILTYTYERIEKNQKRKEYASETVMKNVRVLAIDQTFREEDGEAVVVGRTATLEMPNNFAEELALAGAMGKLSLSLRSLASAEGELNDMKPRLVKSYTKGNQDEEKGKITMVRFGRPQTEAEAQ
ncbi:MAG: Flp pilus assembly protein CpaB [Alphaproteobacteria bacterium]|nr:MAG: Flp pilus assembly protein CpaB [Alphaproteobacteria bacterium]